MELFLRQKRGWIVRKLEEFAKLPELGPFPLEDGAALPYLGESITLRFVAGPGSPVLTPSGELEIPIGSKTTLKGVHRKVNDWYRGRCRSVAEAATARLSDRAGALGIPAPKEVRCRRMRRRWGSCMPTGTILLNSELLGAPPDCFDYVVAHELCHLKEANHSPRFYELMSRFTPEWKELRRRLNRESPLGFLEPPAE